jgi:hypothetical protein
LVYDDFSTNNLNKWDNESASAATVSNKQLAYIQDAYFGEDYIISADSFDLSGANSSYPAELEITVKDRTWNTSAGENNYLTIGWSDADGNMVFGFQFLWSLASGADINNIYNGSSYAGAWYSTPGVTYFNDGDKLTLRVTDTTVDVLKNGTLFRSVTKNYSGSLAGLKAIIGFVGPNNSGTVIMDDVKCNVTK